MENLNANGDLGKKEYEEQLITLRFKKLKTGFILLP